MSRHVFFSFDYADVKNFKVNVVRNSWLLSEEDESFVDGSIWEKSKIKRALEIKAIIDKGLDGTSATAVLIGATTSSRRFVRYEIVKSFAKGNGIIGVHINRIRGKAGITARGLNPLDRLAMSISKDGKKIHFYELRNYRWRVFDDFPLVNNRKTNSVYAEDGIFFNNYGKSYVLSTLFPTYCWEKHDGRANLSQWVDKAASEARRTI